MLLEILFLWVGVLILLEPSRRISLVLRTLRWPSVTGKIITARRNKLPGSNKFSPNIEYTYIVNSETYSNSRINIPIAASWGLEMENSFIKSVLEKLFKPRSPNNSWDRDDVNMWELSDLEHYKFSKSRIVKFLKPYRHGRDVTVYYKPNNPQHSVIKRSVPIHPTILFLALPYMMFPFLILSYNSDGLGLGMGLLLFIALLWIHLLIMDVFFPHPYTK